MYCLLGLSVLITIFSFAWLSYGICFAFSVYNNICRPSKLPTGADFYCFKNEIEPKWEDPVCANGGKWTMSFHKLKSDTCWLYTVCYEVDLIDEILNHETRGI